jgi:Amt family ammonium transporter
LGSALVSVWSFGIAYLLGTAIEKTIGFRASTEAEVDGIDLAEHAESGYDLVPAGSGSAFALAGVGGGAHAAGNSATPAPAEGQPTEKVPG